MLLNLKKTAILFLFIHLFVLVHAQDIVKKIYVADHYEKCNGIDQKKCLLTRDSFNEKWKLFYGNIEGFHYEEGNEYELLVDIYSIKNTSSDTALTRYVLNKIIAVNKNEIAPKYKLDDQPWFLTKIKSGTKTQDIKSSHAFIRFNMEEKSVNGNAGCNKFFGNIIVTDTSLIINKLGSTKMMCQGSLNNIEKVFMQELPKVTSYKVNGKQLFLYRNKTLLLVFLKK